MITDYSAVFALDNTVVPSIAVIEQYNDNVLFQRTDPQDDFITTVHPGLGVSVESEITDVEASADAYLNYYAKETDLNDQAYRGELLLDSQFLERWRFQASGEFIRDTTLESQLLETGRVFNRDDRNQFEGNLRGTLAITELTSLSIGYLYRQVEYESADFVNYNVDSISMNLSRKLKNQIDTLSIHGGYSYNESPEREIDTYSAGLGWRRELTDIYSIRVSGGYRTTKTLNINRDEKTSDGATFDIRLSRKGETYDAFIGYRRGLTNAASGEYLEYDRVYGRVERNLSERSKVGLNGRIVFSRDNSDIAANNNRFFQVEPSYSYNVTENSVASVGYRYSEDYDDNLEGEKSASRNVVWVLYRINLPYKF
jgi:hypothetical protein